jgi:hypothetical protein
MAISLTKYRLLTDQGLVSLKTKTLVSSLTSPGDCCPHKQKALQPLIKLKHSGSLMELWMPHRSLFTSTRDATGVRGMAALLGFYFASRRNSILPLGTSVVVDLIKTVPPCSSIMVSL